MPEGPEVRVVTEGLRSRILGKEIKNITLDSKSKYFGKWNDLSFPYKVTAVECKGKNIFIFLTSGDKEVILYNHLRMTGRWLVEKDDWSHTCFHVDDFMVYYSDSRQLGVFEWMTREQYTKKLKGIGHDLLSAPPTIVEWTKLLKNKRLGRKQICDFLMEQKYCSGVGNYLKSEILYIAKIRPDRLLPTLSDEEIKTLYEVTLKTIKLAYESGGLTIRDYFDINGKRGTFKVFIYGKKGGQTDSEGNKIHVDTFKDGRTTYWVPSVQK